MQLPPNVYIDNNGYLTIEQPTLDDYKIYGMSGYHGRTGGLKDRHTLVVPKILGQVKKYKVGSDGRFIELKSYMKKRFYKDYSLWEKIKFYFL